MKKKAKKTSKKSIKMCCGDMKDKCGCGGGLYCLGFIGAAIYYISTATGFWNGVWGVIKALLWPGFLVHGLLKFLGL